VGNDLETNSETFAARQQILSKQVYTAVNWVTPSQTNMFSWKQWECNSECCFLRGLSRDVITETSLEVSQL
jgi:hypothetical protein